MFPSFPMIVRTSLERNTELRRRWVLLLVLTLTLSAAPACRKEMSVQEARDIAVSMSDAPLSASSGNGVDVFEILAETDFAEPEEARRLRERADALPPPALPPLQAAEFLSRRSDAAWALGRYVQAGDDALLALRTARNAKNIPPKTEARLLSKAARSITALGEFKKAEAMYAESLALVPHPGACLALAEARLKRGDYTGAQSITDKGLSMVGKLKKKKGNKKNNAGKGNRKLGRWTAFEHRLKIRMFMARGEYPEAEEQIRALIRLYSEQGGEGMRPLIRMRASLARVLARQEKLSEAEYEAAEAAAEAVALSGKNSGLTADMLADLVDVLMRRGRFEDAERAARLRMEIYREADLPPDSGKIASAEFSLGRIASARGDDDAALRFFNNVRSGINPASRRSAKFGMRSPEFILSLVVTGNPKQALALTDAALEAVGRGAPGRSIAELKGLEAGALFSLGRPKQALPLFLETVPVLVDKYESTSNRAKKNRLRTIIEMYMRLLCSIQDTPLEGHFERVKGTSPADEAFRLADRLSATAVRSALTAGGVRAAAGFDPELADLVRREQDTGLRLEALEETLSGLMASSDDATEGETENLRKTISLLSEARKVLRSEVESRFPKYADMLSPEPPDMEKARSLLLPGEALLVIHPGHEAAMVWGIPEAGPVRFTSVPLGARKLAEKVEHLRGALACNPAYLGDIPSFDTLTAHELYNTLVHPVQSAFARSRSLIVVAGGPLSALPFSVLTTEQASVPEDRDVLFREYRAVPWLAREFSVSRVPSVSSLASLRSGAGTPSNRSPMIGFGDPFFNPARLSHEPARNRTTTRSAILVRNAGRLTRPLAVRGDVSSEKPTIERLSPLPDTRTELLRIARTLNADPEDTIFLGKAAAEDRLKSMDLSGSRVLVFATHALHPGDLQGLDQPALALAAPSVTGGREDGLLTMAEIMPLELNADWVVLSACDTGSGKEAEDETLSGLGRAFFYAGSRAVLVTLWPVETGSAAMLTTGLFRFRLENPGMSRAEALNRSMLQLMDGPGIPDPDTGMTMADYAHPFFWAPFIIAGEGGE